MTEPTEHACAFMMIYYGSPRERMHSASSSPARLGKVETTRSWCKGHPRPPPAHRPVLPPAPRGAQLTVKKAKVRTMHFSSRSPWKSREQVYQDCTDLSMSPLPPLLQLQSFPWGHLGALQADIAAPASLHLPSFSQMIIIAGNQPSPSHSVGLRGA